jgi:hypothetical protein
VGHETRKKELHGGKMATRKIGVLVGAALLAACASTNGVAPGQSAGLTSATYAVGSSGSAVNGVKTAEDNGSKPTTVPEIAGESKPMRIFWFLGGR